MKVNIGLGIRIFIAIAALYIIFSITPLIFKNTSSNPLESTEPELTTTSIPGEIYVPGTPSVISKNGTTGIGTPSAPLKESSQQGAADQAEQQLEQEIESATGNQSDQDVVDVITGSAIG